MKWPILKTCRHVDLFILNGLISFDDELSTAYLLCFLFLALDSTLVFRHDTLGPHTHCQTLLQSAFLTFAPHVHIDLAIVPVFTLVYRVLGDAAPEEALTALAGQCVVVITGGTVTTDQAQFLLLPRGRSFLLPGVTAVAAATSTAPSASTTSATTASITVQRARLRQLVPTCKQILQTRLEIVPY